ncbi:MAG: DUF934 domain-containing protein [Betaproteobacteria bacterium]|nr:DUF934 domain-containing protein [Betaproteobacteria bacterium]
MTTLIKNRQIVADSWRLLDPTVAAGDRATDHVIVLLSQWRQRREDFLAHTGALGIQLEGHDDPDAIAADLGRFALVAIHFQQFADGRGYSLARLLRERYRYTGEIRAVGDVLRDQLFYLSRVGFDAFALREDQDAEEALKAFSDFSEGYQASVERPSPLFRRRITAPGNRLPQFDRPH